MPLYIFFYVKYEVEPLSSTRKWLSTNTSV